MMVYVRFECNREDRYSEQIGPFAWLQMTYHELRLPPSGDNILAIHRANGDWETGNGQTWSDFIISAHKEVDPDGAEKITAHS